MIAAPLPDLVAESQRVLAAARERGVVVRLAGGLAIRHICPAAGKPPLNRQYADLDLAYVEECRTLGQWDLVKLDLGILRTTFRTMLRGEGLSY